MRIGKQGESIVGNLFESDGWTVEFNNTLEFDIKIQKKRTSYTIEVKYDVMAERTGNMCIEFYNSNKNAHSGINGTLADLWCVVLPDGEHKTLWITSTDLLRSYIKLNTPLRIVENAGDKNATVYLYKIDDISQIFKRLDLSTDYSKTLKELKELKQDE